MEGRDAPLWRCPRLPSPEARSPPRRADWAVRIQVPVREGGAGSSSSAAAHRGAPTAPLAPGRAVGSVAVGAQPGTAPALPGPRSGCAGRPGALQRHPLSPGRAVRSKPWGSIRGGRELQGRRPRLRPIRASVPTGVLGWWTSSECHCGPGSGRSWRASRLSADARGVGAPARPRTARRGLPAQRGRGRFGGRRCTRGRRHTRPVRPVRLGAGAGGSVAERPGHSKRWLARIFHPPPRAPPVPKWRNDAIPHERRSRRAPESHAPATFFRPADAPDHDGEGAGGPDRARTFIDRARTAAGAPDGRSGAPPGPTEPA